MGNFIGLLSPDWRNDKMFIVRYSPKIIAPSVEVVAIENIMKKDVTDAHSVINVQ